MLPQAAEALRLYLGGTTVDEHVNAFRAHYLLGQVLEQSGDRQAAIDEYRSLAGNGPRLSPGARRSSPPRRMICLAHGIRLSRVKGNKLMRVALEKGSAIARGDSAVGFRSVLSGRTCSLLQSP